MRTAAAADDAGRPAFVVFATDGQATDGVTDRQGLIDLATAANLLAKPALDPFGKSPEFKFCAARISAAETVAAE